MHDHLDTVNLDTLDALKALQEVGEGDFLTELIDAYLTDAPIRLEALKNAITNIDFDQITKSAHGLKGASGNLGAEKLAAFLLEIEIAGKNRKLQVVQFNFENTMSEYSKVESIFRLHRKPLK